MKNLPSTICMFLFAISFSAQPEWSPIGAKWKYVVTDNYGYVQEKLYECKGEEMYAGKLCRVIEENGFKYYSYEENGQVFFYNNIDSSFQIRYDFNKQAGESWQFLETQDTLTVTVDSVYARQYSGQTFQLQHVTITDPNIPCCPSWEDVVIGMGSAKFFSFPFVDSLTTEFTFGLACYFSEETGVLEVVAFPNVEIDCDALSVETDEVTEEGVQVLLYPNPAADFINVEMQNPSINTSGWSVYNTIGQQVLFQKIEKKAMRKTISLIGIPSGLYFWEMKNGGGRLGSGKLIISK